MSAVNASRSWILTIPAVLDGDPDSQDNGYDQSEVELILQSYTYIGQLERGEDVNVETGKHYLHWQVYIENETPIRFTTLQSKFSKKAIHIERRMFKKSDAYAYVTKSDTSVGVHIHNGEIDLVADSGKRTDLQNISDELMLGVSEDDVFLKYPASARYMSYVRKLRDIYIRKSFGQNLRLNLNVIYIYGLSGVGKTRYVYDKFGFQNVYRVNDYSHPFDNYDSQSVLVFDEFYSQIPIELMLTLLDIYPVQLPARFSNKWLCADKIFILSNKSLEYQYELKEDRFGVQRIFFEQRKAFLRRIHEVYEIDKDGKLIPRPREPTYSYHLYDNVVDWQLQKIPDDQELPF